MRLLNPNIAKPESVPVLQAWLGSRRRAGRVSRPRRSAPTAPTWAAADVPEMPNGAAAAAMSGDSRSVANAVVVVVLFMAYLKKAAHTTTAASLFFSFTALFWGVIVRQQHCPLLLLL